MMEDAKAKGLTSEKMMWESVDEVQDMLCALKMEHPHKYWKFIRKTHGLLFKGHYTEEFAMHDIEHMKPLGMFWTVAQAEEAVKGVALPSGVNKYDVAVALNAFKNDLDGILSDDMIIKTAIAFWFHDKDFDGADKIWRYMCMVYDK